MRTWSAAVAATLVQPLLYALVHLDYFLSIISPATGAVILATVFLMASGVVFLAGLPLFLLLRRLGLASRKSVCAGGMALGMLATALLAYPWPQEETRFAAGQAWHGSYVETFTQGLPTGYAWAIYGETILLAGLRGLASALVFYAVWQRFKAATPPPAAIR